MQNSLFFHNGSRNWCQYLFCLPRPSRKLNGLGWLVSNNQCSCTGLVCFACYVSEREKGAVVNGDAVNGVETSGELTPSSDADSVTLDDHTRAFKQDVITITGRRENCEAARDAMLVRYDILAIYLNR